MPAIHWSLWYLVGFLVSIPYTFLANGGWEQFWLTASASPLAVGVLLLINSFRRQIACRCDMVRPQGPSRRQAEMVMIYSYLGCIFLPIVMNGASLLFKMAGKATMSQVAFDYRYSCVLLVPVSISIVVMLVEAIRRLIRPSMPSRTIAPR